MRHSKYEPLCDEVDLVAINPTHARVRFPCGREASVSLRHLAPLPNSDRNLQLTSDLPGPVIEDVKDSSARVQRTEATPTQPDISLDISIYHPSPILHPNLDDQLDRTLGLPQTGISTMVLHTYILIIPWRTCKLSAYFKLYQSYQYYQSIYHFISRDQIYIRYLSIMCVACLIGPCFIPV